MTSNKKAKTDVGHLKKFSANELDALVDGVSKYHEQLFGSFSNSVTTDVKEKLWDSITNQVNSVGTSVPREKEKIKHKWGDWKSRTKIKVATIRKMEQNSSGRNEIDFPTLTSQEEKVVALIGEKAIAGLDGGIDTWGPTEHAAVHSSESPSVIEDNENIEQTFDDVATGSYCTPATPSTSSQPQQPPPSTPTSTRPTERVCHQQKEQPMRHVPRERAAITSDTATERLIQLEKEKLVVLTRIATSLEKIASTMRSSPGQAAAPAAAAANESCGCEPENRGYEEGENNDTMEESFCHAAKSFFQF